VQVGSPFAHSVTQIDRDVLPFILFISPILDSYFVILLLIQEIAKMHHFLKW